MTVLKGFQTGQFRWSVLGFTVVMGGFNYAKTLVSDQELDSYFWQWLAVFLLIPGGAMLVFRRKLIERLKFY